MRHETRQTTRVLRAEVNKQLVRPSWHYFRQLILTVFLSILASFVLASKPGYDGARIYSFAHSPGNPDTVFAVGDGIYKSTDGGRIWQALSVPWQFEMRLEQVLVDPHEKQHVITFETGFTSTPGSYLESADSGKSWVLRSILNSSQMEQFGKEHRNISNIQSFSMHASNSGLWLATVDGRLFRTLNSGIVWDVVSQAKPQSFLHLSAVHDRFYAVSENQVWKSADGLDWNIKRVPGDLPIERFTVFGNGVLMLRTQKGWFESLDDGPWEETTFLSTYELRHVKDGKEGPKNHIYRRVRDFCSPRMSPADQKYLFATCSNNNMPMSGAIDFGAQLHSMDGGLTWSAIKGEGLPGAWFPTAVELHSTDSRIMLMAWITGRIYRSSDGGVTWQSSDTGTTFPPNLKYLPEYGLPYLRETPLVQAVFKNDLVAISALLSSGVDINAKGNLGKTPLEWAIILGTDLDLQTIGESLYWELRARGAVATGQHAENGRGVIELAAQRGFVRVVEDLLRSGWRLTWKSADENARSTFMRAVASCGVNPVSGCRPTLAGRALEYWVSIHLSLAQPGESAQLVLDLTALGEVQLAHRVALFDSGKYKNAAVLVGLLKEIPAEAIELRSTIFKSLEQRKGSAIYSSRLEDEDAAFLAGVLVREVKRLDLAALLLKNSGSDLGQHTIDLVVQLIKDNRADLAFKLARNSQFLSSGHLQALLSGRLAGLCNVNLLERALKVGFKLTATTDDGQSTIKTALWVCQHDKSSIAPFIDRLHRYGLRLARHEWSLLESHEVDTLRRSNRSGYYIGFEGQIAGVGLQWQESAVHIKVAKVIPGFPAEVAGIRAGDRVVMIDGVDTRAMSVFYASLLTRGKPGTRVALTVFRDGQRTMFKMRRRSLELIDQTQNAEK